MRHLILLAAAFTAVVGQNLRPTLDGIEKVPSINTRPTIGTIGTVGTVKPSLDVNTKFPTIGINKCGVVDDKTQILGYSLDQRQAVYQRKCAGICLSRVDVGGGNTQQYECKPNLYRKVKVYTTPLWYTETLGITRFYGKLGNIKLVKDTKTVIQLAGCGCLPASCKVKGRTYAHGATVFNGCGDRCKCSYGKLVNCCRRRKSFTRMSHSERSRYTQAVYDLSKGTGGATPALKAQYDSMIAQHTTWFHSGIHTPSEFLPWHRWFLKNFEDLIRQVDQCITVPYWDWAADAADPWGSPLWNPGQSWFGGGTGGSCVPDGPFTTPFYLTPSEGTNQCLRRRRIGSVPTAMQVTTMLSDPSFNSFQSTLDGMHGGVHCSIHGTMCTLGSANAPEFFLHHAQVDRLWAKWQAQSSGNQMAFTAGAIDTPMNGGATPRELMKLHDHMDVCVEYAEPRWIIDIFEVLKALPPAVLRGIPAARPTWTQQAGWWFASVRELPAAEVRQRVQTLQETLYSAPELIPEDGDDFATRFGVRLDDIYAAVEEWAHVSPDDKKQAEKLRTTLDDLQADAQFAFV